MATSLLDWVAHLLRDSDARHAFEDHPHRYAEEHGFHHLSNADVHDVLNLILDGEHQYGNHHHHYPAPHHWEHGHHESGADYLRAYFHDNRDHFQDRWDDDRDRDHDRNDHDRNDHDRNNHDGRWDDDRDHDGRHDTRDVSFERHNTDIDNSVHQRIDTGGRDHDRHDGWGDDRHERGGDFHQTIDNDPVVASGNHSVASGGDIRDSTITSGNRNVVGDHNHAVTGDDNTTAFGSGEANNSNLDHVSTGHGGAISVGGDAHGSDEHNETTTAVHNSGSGSTSVTSAGDHGYANQYADQHESDNSTHSNYEDHSSSDTHNEIDSNNDSRYEDSHDLDVHH
jgi:hypothetical protein